MSRVVAAVAAAVGTVIGCTSRYDCTVATDACGLGPLAYEFTPSSLRLTVGDTGIVRISVTVVAR